MQPTQASDQTAPMPILTPEELAPHFPQLEIIECLGRGGMGVVYKARQKSLNRLVALKLLAPERADDPHFAERFEKEALALAALNHPHIVGVYDFGHAGGFYFLLMEFVDGVNLRQAMKAGRFTPEQALAVVPPVCEALQYAHEHGIVHRDIKPENLLLDKEGRVKIADFGIAKMLGESGTGILPVSVESTGKMPVPHSFVAGTPQYMSPEQKAHGVTDHRADIYSLGVVLYEMLTGELPADKLQPPSRKVQIDVRLDEIVLRALEKTPELRYQTAGEFRTQVETVVATPDGSRREPARTSLNPSGQSGHKSAQANTADRVSHHVALIAFISAYAGLLFLLVSTASQLPPRVASHFGLEGQPNGWMGRASYLALFGCLPLLFGGVAVLISWMTRRLPARFINIPRRDFWLTPERRPAVAAFLRRRMFWLAVLMTAFLAGLHLLTVHANQSVPVHLSMDGLLALVIAFLLALLVWTICLLMRLAEVDKPLCVAQPGNNPPPSPVATGNGSALGKWAFGLFLTGILGSLLLMAV
ncbi:MAG: protein kinase, partial [Verrucomicrobia bacterium]|nr:protein kinase [Verrucomicrobiota bacterium]